MQNSRHKQTKSLLYHKQAEQRKLQKSSEKVEEENEIDHEMQWKWFFESSLTALYNFYED